MDSSPDPVTVALTGVPLVGVLAGGVLAYPVGRFLLRLYHRSVARAMASVSAGDAAARPGVGSPMASSAALRITDWSGSPEDAVARAELAYLLRAPWYGAAVYVVAGAVFAAVMTAGWLAATRDAAIPLTKVALLFWIYLWPAVLTVNLVAGTRPAHRIALGAYFCVFLAIVAVAMARNPTVRWHEWPWFWALTNLPPTLLLAAYLTRRIRAVGPMVLAFLVLTATGSQVPAIASNAPGVLAGIGRAGLSAAQIRWAMILGGLILFATLGWVLLKRLGRRYQDKRLSDQMLTVDALWLLFAVVHSIDLVFEGWAWIFTGLVAFAAFKAVTGLGFARLRSGARPAPRTLLLLRVFSLGPRSARLFDRVRQHWLGLGPITLIAGPDLITSTVEPHEFLAFVGGNLSRQFVRDRADLDRRLSGMDTARDPDGRYRVNEFFCHADTWQTTMHALAGRSHVVLMDLRSFSSANQGCLFELGELLGGVDLDRVLFVIDASTDRPFLENALADLWSKVPATSPNHGKPSPAVRLLALDTRPAEPALPRLFAGLCAARRAPA